jgi:hypothetical protein
VDDQEHQRRTSRYIDANREEHASADSRGRVERLEHRRRSLKVESSVQPTGQSLTEMKTLA